MDWLGVSVSLIILHHYYALAEAAMDAITEAKIVISI